MHDRLVFRYHADRLATRPQAWIGTSVPDGSYGVNLEPFVVGEWTEVSIPLARFTTKNGAASLPVGSRIHSIIVSISDQSDAIVHVDDIRMVGPARQPTPEIRP